MLICFFYFVLCGFDIIEDDMIFDIKEKEFFFCDFYNIMEQDGWIFDKNGFNEKDRELFVYFDDIIFELKKVKKLYYDIIKDIIEKMGNGMVDYVFNVEYNNIGVGIIKEYELYCYYVVGLVGEGLICLFVESNFVNL